MKIRLSNLDWERLDDKLTTVDKPNITYIYIFILFCLSFCLFMTTSYLIENTFQLTDKPYLQYKIILVALQTVVFCNQASFLFPIKLNLV